MSQYIIKVSETLTDNANYKELTDIPAAVLSRGDTTVLVYPGAYTAPTAAVYDDVAFIGVGEMDEIVVNGGVTIANTSANTITFENMHFVGANTVQASLSTCVTKLGASSVPLYFRNVKFSNAIYAVQHNGEAAFATTTKQVTMDYCDASAVDMAIVANANVAVNWSALNTGSNAYFTPGTGGGAAALTVSVRASTSGGSNTGNNTETVIALIS